MITTDYMAIARGLQHSNVKEVAELAQGYLKLAERFNKAEAQLAIANKHIKDLQEERHDLLDRIEDLNQ